MRSYPSKFPHQQHQLSLNHNYKPVERLELWSMCHLLSTDIQFLKHFSHHSSSYFSLHYDLSKKRRLWVNSLYKYVWSIEYSLLRHLPKPENTFLHSNLISKSTIQLVPLFDRLMLSTQNCEWNNWLLNIVDPQLVEMCILRVSIDSASKQWCLDFHWTGIRRRMHDILDLA